MNPVAYHSCDLLEWSDGTLTASPAYRAGDRFPREILLCAVIDLDDLLKELREQGHTDCKRVIILDPLWN